MTGDMQFQNAPKDHLETWGRVTKMVFWSCVGVAVLLVVMAATLL
jgi:hypothetical protein